MSAATILAFGLGVLVGAAWWAFCCYRWLKIERKQRRLAEAHTLRWQERYAVVSAKLREDRPSEVAFVPDDLVARRRSAAE